MSKAPVGSSSSSFLERKGLIFCGGLPPLAPCLDTPPRRMEDDLSSSLVVSFSEDVGIVFFDQSEWSGSWLKTSEGKVKKFDGRSDVVRGVLIETEIGAYLANMSIDPKEEVVLVDNKDDAILWKMRRRRGRSYAQHWDLDGLDGDKYEHGESDGGGCSSNLELWLMENTPCDCDLISSSHNSISRSSNRGNNDGDTDSVSTDTTPRFE